MSTAKEHGDAHRSVDLWEENHRAESGMRVVSGADLLTYPEPARWHVFHDDCVEGLGVEPQPYEIGLHRVRTHEHLVAWTAHLMHTKAWLRYTNWPDVLETHAPPIPS